MAGDPESDVAPQLTHGGPLDGLNPEQRRAAEAVNGPVCILAGAGTGKTRTITHRIAHQVAVGAVRADQVLAVTFTERAARELRDRVTRLGLPSPVRAATFHAAAWAQLRWAWPQLDAGPLPAVLESKLGLLAPVAARERVEAKDLASEIEWAKARCLTPEAYEAEATRADRDAALPPNRMAAVYARYEQTKTDRGVLDFEDMVLRTTAMLREREDLAAVVRDRYRAFTVDEYQDVNPAQQALLDTWLGDRRDLCVVGDDDQTIYSFTGASSSYLIGFRRRWPDAPLVTLTRNYRSTPQILTLANRVLGSGGHPRDPRGAKPPHLRKQLRATLADGPSPIIGGHEDDDAERAALVEQVRAWLAAGVAAREIAVLYRVNSQSVPLAEAFATARIPAAVRGDAGFYDLPEVRQALTVLRAAGDGPRDDGPPPPGGALPGEPPRADRLVAQVLRDTMAWNPNREPGGRTARERWRNLGALVEAARRLVDAQPATSFRDLVAALSARGEDEVGPEAVVLSTLHRAKGLEFDAVAIVAVEEGLLPISYAGDDEDAVEEERRLLYVGVTRARRHLWLSWAGTRPGWGGRIQARRPSRFLYGLGDGAPVKAERPAALPLRGAAPAAKPSVLEDLDADARALAEQLQTWRAERARADGVPAYVVFPNTTLAALAVARPSDHAALARVAGFGPKRVREYGDDVIGVIARSRTPDRG